MEDRQFQSFTDKVLAFADSQPDDIACTFQRRGIETAESLAYSMLRERVISRAMLLEEKGLVGQNVALIFPTGNDFVVNFLACLTAGVVAVPLNLSRNKAQLSRTLDVLKDADASAVITMADTAEFIDEILNELEIYSDTLDWIDEYSHPSRLKIEEASAITKPDDLAFIQYTSGSTSRPKGVMVTQRNIVDNQESIRKACLHTHGLIAGGWLPQFHDMGLIGHMLQPLYMGGRYVFMPPLNFIQRPRRWLELISSYRISSSASPNFGYEHCVRSIRELEDLSAVDLSCWRVALNGSEPVNSKTMTSFADRFMENGFNPSAFFPCFGMAETTLFVSGGPVGAGVRTISLNREQFAKGLIKQEEGTDNVDMVSCGVISDHFNVRIVNPDTGIACRKTEIGEVWLQGGSVAQGYWANNDLTIELFRAKIIGDKCEYMRTGDMGYLHENELYITGRIKEMIVIRGRNLYPYDIERECNEHPKSTGTTAVVTYKQEDVDLLVALVEIKKLALARDNLDEIKQEMKARVVDNFDITLDQIHLVKPGVIPKTTSGKIKRTSCQFLIDSLIPEKLT